MSFDDAIRAVSVDALKFVQDGQVLGLGSGRAAASFVESLSKHIAATKINVVGVPTSLQIKIAAEEGGIPVIDADRAGEVDVVFDGADQINSKGYLIKGGGGALLRENILISAARRVVIMADDSKFVDDLTRPVPVEVHPSARTTAVKPLLDLGCTPRLRLLANKYPFITENGNVILDCDFGTIHEPEILRQKIIGLAGIMEVGIFTRRPNVIYRAHPYGRFTIL